MKRVIFYVLMLPMVLGMMISCSEAKTDAKKLEGKWNVIEVKGEKILKEGLPYMEFDMAQNKLHGNAGCNMFNSSFTLDDKDISSITIQFTSIHRLSPILLMGFQFIKSTVETFCHIGFLLCLAHISFLETVS